MKLPEVHLGHTVWSCSVVSAVFSNVVAVEQLIDDATLHILSTGEPCKLKRFEKFWQVYCTRTFYLDGVVRRQMLTMKKETFLEILV